MRLSCSSFTALVRALSFARSLTTKQSINSRLFPTGAPLLFFVLTYYNRDALKQLLLTVHETDMHLDNHALRGSITIGQAARPLRGSITIGQAARRPSLFARWPSSHVAFAAESIRLNWLVKKVERFVPSCWWFRSLQLLLRVAQTSLMVLVERQHVQCSVASAVALVGVCIHREMAPFCRPSVRRSLEFVCILTAKSYSP